MPWNRTGAHAIERLTHFDLMVCRKANRIDSRPLLALFATVSRLADGIVWYALMLALPALYGAAGLETSLRMAVVGSGCLAVYTVVKRAAARPRPYATSDQIKLRVPPLDHYAFPSGHTMHAVAFSLVVCTAHPEWTAVLVPFAVLVALSRPILGLHYPSDVVAGAALGASIAIGFLLV